MKTDKITGSRYSDGNVPNVNWNRDNRKVYVNWYNVDNANDNLRTRAEVSSLKEPCWLFLCVSQPSQTHFRNFLQISLEIKIGLVIKNF